MRRHFKDDLFREIIVDNFAGGGGASTGIELALGVPVDIAINHDEYAIRMHQANHPYTEHYLESVWDIDPTAVTSGRQVGLAWFSPDCTHFSKAKGGKPKKKEIRGLAWVVIRWAATVKPRVIMLENVEEFKSWGPLDSNGHPIKEKEGKTFESWLKQLKELGYDVEIKELRACDYGAPTTRKRLFVIARCDGEPIVWPKATHGNEKELIPFRTAAEVIDWEVTGESIFNRKKDLVRNTLRRVTRGITKFVIENDNPFILDMENKRYINPTIIPIGYGEAKRQKPRVNDSLEPLGTLVGTIKHNVVIPHIIKHYSGARGSDINEPLHTITSTDHNGLVSSILSSYYSSGDNAAPVYEPVRTITGVARHSLVNVRFEKVENKEYGNWELIRNLLNEHGGYDLKDDEIIVFEIDSEDYIMIDITMRMLLPKELYAAQGFPVDYDYELGGKMIKTEQVKKVGNSVCPQLATALVRANFDVRDVPKLKTMDAFMSFASSGYRNILRDKE